MSDHDDDSIPDAGAEALAGAPEAEETFVFDHPVFAGATVHVETPADQVVRNRMYELGEAFFRQFGPQCRDNGWAVYPQTREGTRRPWLIPGVGAIRILDLQDAPPSAEDVDFWAKKAPSANVACVAGPGSGGMIGIDIDVGDPLLSADVQRVAYECLGQTPFRRQGRVPRMMLLYRQALEEYESAATIIPNMEFKFATAESAAGDGDLVPSGDAIEILGKGKSLTFYGAHHATGDYFRWGELAPVFSSSEELPLITRDALELFLERTSQLRPFANTRAGKGDPKADFEYDPEAGAKMPRLKPGQHTDWVEDANGFVIDGREKYLFWLTRQVLAGNKKLFPVVDGKVQAPDSEGANKLKSMIVNAFKKGASTTGKWHDANLKSQVSEKYPRIVQGFVDGSSRFHDDRKGGERNQVPAQPRKTGKPDDLGFIGAGIGARESVDAVFHGDPAALVLLPGGDKAAHDAEVRRLEEERDRKRAERALIPDRTEIAQDVQSRITASLDAFFAEVYPERPVDESQAPSAEERIERARGACIHVLRAPTGAGKTSRTIHYIGTDPRTKKYDHLIDSGEENVETKSPGPILFLLPTYNNIDELRERAEFLNLDKSLSDEELGQQAADRGLIAIEDIELRLKDLRRNAESAGLRSMVYRGKEAAGCKMVDKLRLLMSAGISTAGLCRAEVRDKDGEKEEKFCVHYHECPAIQQRKEIARSHVVFLAHAFMTLNVPEELKTVRAVVADERIFHLFVHTTTFPMDIFKKGRNMPKLTKKEREAVKAGQGEDEVMIMRSRDSAAREVTAAFHRRECPATALFNYEEINESGTKVTGLDLVLAAKRVCGGSMQDSSAITPDIDVREIQSLCNAPVGDKVYEEWRFWKIMEERIMLLREDNTGTAALARQMGRPWPRMAKGDREMRVQYILHPEQNQDGDVTYSELVRISWRDTPNWKDAPLLLLDASAETAIIKKIFTTREPKAGGNGYMIVEREVVEHEVPAPLNVRTIAIVDSTYSNAALLYRGENYRDRMMSMKLLTKMRNLLSSVSAWYGWGRVVAGANTIIRKAICNDWATPSNVDFCHFGAMRGLDFAKEHVAAVSFGRMEIPVGTVDGLVAALTYDDDEPELPFDLLGNGFDPDEPDKQLRVPMVPQPMPMRSGLDVSISIPVYPGEWAKKVQAQYREEELRQFVGRLRPVYREGEAPVWIAASRVIPSGIVIDEVVSLKDLLLKSRQRSVRLWQAVRQTDGVAHPKLLLAVASSQFKDEKDVIDEMKLMGLDPVSGRIDPLVRQSWGFTPIRVQSPDQSISYAFVRTEYKDPCGHFAAVMERHLDWMIDEHFYELQPAYKPRVAGRVREADKVEIELGTREERAIREQIGTQSIISEAANRFEASAFVDSLAKYAGSKEVLTLTMPISIKIPVPGLNAPIDMTIEELGTDRSTQLLDQRLGKARITEFSPAIMDPKQDYSHLSDTVRDDI